MEKSANNGSAKHDHIFIPAALDEFGFSASEFRVACHVARRGNCFAALATIAVTCRLNRDTVIACLKSLVGRGVLSKETHPGETSTYRLNPMSKWEPAGNGGAGSNGNGNGTYRKPRGRGQRKARGTTCRKATGDHLPETRGHKGNPSEVDTSEGNPRKGITPSASSASADVSSMVLLDEVIERKPSSYQELRDYVKDHAVYYEFGELAPSFWNHGNRRGWPWPKWRVALAALHDYRTANHGQNPPDDWNPDQP